MSNSKRYPEETSKAKDHDQKKNKDKYRYEESLSKELGYRKDIINRQEKMRQLLWETSPELQELRQKLLIASVTRDQAMQIAEKQATMELNMREDEALAEKLRQDKEALEKEEQRKEIEELQAKLNYHKDLDELRRFKMMQDSSGEDEREKERNAIDDVRRQIEQDAKDQANKEREKQIELRKQMDELVKVRDEIRLQEKLADQGNHLKAEEYLRAQDLRTKQQEEKKQLSLRQKLQIQEELLSYLEEIISEKARKEVLRIELAVEEKNAAETKKEQETEQQNIKIRKDLQRVYDMQIHVKKQREELLKKEEELYRQNMMAKLYEEDKLELMSQQKRHQKKLEHMRITQSMMDELNKKKTAERDREIAVQKYEEKLKGEHDKAVHAEKLRFLKECAGELLGYLPKGMFDDKETIEKLGDDFRKFYSRSSCSK